MIERSFCANSCDGFISGSFWCWYFGIGIYVICIGDIIFTCIRFSFPTTLCCIIICEIKSESQIKANQNSSYLYPTGCTHPVIYTLQSHLNRSPIPHWSGLQVKYPLTKSHVSLESISSGLQWSCDSGGESISSFTFTFLESR